MPGYAEKDGFPKKNTGADPEGHKSDQEREDTARSLLNILSCYGLIPLGASFLGALPLFFGVPSWTCLVTVPLLSRNTA